MPRASALAGQMRATGVLSLRGCRGSRRLSAVGLTSAEEEPHVSQALFTLRHVSASSPHSSETIIPMFQCMSAHVHTHTVFTRLTC